MLGTNIKTELQLFWVEGYRMMQEIRGECSKGLPGKKKSIIQQEED